MKVCTRTRIPPNKIIELAAFCSSLFNVESLQCGVHIHRESRYIVLTRCHTNFVRSWSGIPRVRNWLWPAAIVYVFSMYMASVGSLKRHPLSMPTVRIVCSYFGTETVCNDQRQDCKVRTTFQTNTYAICRPASTRFIRTMPIRSSHFA